MVLGSYPGSPGRIPSLSLISRRKLKGFSTFFFSNFLSCMFLSAAVRNGKEDTAAAFEVCDFPEGFEADFFRFGTSSSSSSSESIPEAERADDRDVERRSPSEGMEAASELLASSGTIKSSSSSAGLRFLSGWVVSECHGQWGMGGSAYMEPSFVEIS